MTVTVATGRRVAGKVALVTGAGSGIGRQIALRLSQEGAAVVIADIDPEGLRQTRGLLCGESESVELDVRQDTQWAGVVAHVAARFEAIDVLVNCAGIARVEDSIATCSLEAWEQTMAVNVTGAFLACRHSLPLMRPGGSIINIGSIRSFVGSADRLAYSTSKSALLGLTRSIALHCAREKRGIRANIICPGGINTPLGDTLRSTAQDQAAALAQEVLEYPVGTLGEPDDIAWLAVHLASDESRFMTGASLVVDGGYSAQ